MQTTNFINSGVVTDINKFSPSMDGVTLSSEPVVVFFPSGNYNQLTELGRYKNLSVAMGILSSINHPDNAYQIPEYKIFSLESGKEIYSH